MEYIIIDIMDNSIVGWFDNENKARKAIYNMRKKRYIKENPTRPIWEYDTIKHDNGFNLYKVNLIA